MTRGASETREAASWHVGEGRCKDTRTARSAAPTQYQRHKDATQSRPYPRQRYPGTYGYLQERVAVGKNRDT